MPLTTLPFMEGKSQNLELETTLKMVGVIDRVIKIWNMFFMIVKHYNDITKYFFT